MVVAKQLRDEHFQLGVQLAMTTEDHVQQYLEEALGQMGFCVEAIIRGMVQKVPNNL